MPFKINPPFARPLAGGVLALAVVSASAHADLLKVPGDFATIQDAVDAAVDGDEIQVDDGTYDGGIQIIDKSITLFSESDDPEACTIIGGSVALVIWGADNDTTVRGFTIRQASRGIEINADASATIQRCIVVDSQTAGGIFMNGAALTMSDCEVIGNKTINAGGGLFIGSGDIKIFDTKIENNLVTGANAFGGGIHLDASASLLLVDSWIEDNEADGNTLGRGGGLYVSGGQATPLTIISTPILSNIASERGGGLFIENRDAYLANLRVTDNVSNASGGGGIWIDNPGNPAPMHVEIINALIAENTVNGGSGAGIRQFLNSNLTVTNATIVKNVINSGLGGGIANGPGCTATFTNSIIVANAPDNIIGDGDTFATYTHTDAGFPGEGNSSGPAQFVDFNLGNYRLSDKSPAVDAGNTIAYRGPAFDLEGNLRAFNAVAPNVGIALSDGAIDMGAYELQADTTCPQDLNNDGQVDGADLAVLLASWGICP